MISGKLVSGAVRFRRQPAYRKAKIYHAVQSREDQNVFQEEAGH
jgi:hypothetical protein